MIHRNYMDPTGDCSEPLVKGNIFWGNRLMRLLSYEYVHLVKDGLPLVICNRLIIFLCRFISACSYLTESVSQWSPLLNLTLTLYPLNFSLIFLSNLTAIRDRFSLKMCKSCLICVTFTLLDDQTSLSSLSFLLLVDVLHWGQTTIYQHFLT